MYRLQKIQAHRLFTAFRGLRPNGRGDVNARSSRRQAKARNAKNLRPAMRPRGPGYGVRDMVSAGLIRTNAHPHKMRVLCPLSYGGMERAEAVNFFRVSAMAMADKHPFASGCPHEKGPRSVVGACPSAGPLPGDLPASGCGVHERTQKPLAKRKGTTSAGGF